MRELTRCELEEYAGSYLTRVQERRSVEPEDAALHRAVAAQYMLSFGVDLGFLARAIVSGGEM